MKLVVGLGNPGKQYENTRHNAGFFVMDEILKKLNLKLDQERFKALYTIYRLGEEKIIFMKPLTFMNLSGEAVLAMSNYYKIAVDDIIVIHDDIDLPLGKLRLRMKGSSGGQNGMGNIIKLLNTQEIKRVRVGVSKDKSIDAKDYVLGHFTKEEFPLYEECVLKARDAVIYALDHRFDVVMNKFN